MRRCRGDQHRLSGGLKKGPNVPNLWQMLAHQHPLPRAGCNQPRLTGHQARSRKGQPLCLGIKLGYRGPLFQESHTIWGRSRVRDGKSERPEEAEVNLNIKQHRLFPKGESPALPACTTQQTGARDAIRTTERPPFHCVVGAPQFAIQFHWLQEKSKSTTCINGSSELWERSIDITDFKSITVHNSSFFNSVILYCGIRFILRYMFMCNLDIFYIYKIFKLTSTCGRTSCLLLLPAMPRSSRHVPALGQVRGALLGYPGRGWNESLEMG